MTDERTQPVAVQFRFDGTALEAPSELTIAGGLVFNGILSWRTTRFAGMPRGLFCGIGTCFDCLVDVNDCVAVRACVTVLRDGDVIRTSCSTGGRDNA
ncbi:MAG: (2Fe-2S)-binding protein [Acidimicrobiales bacterium]|jgi:D-hydroxyproline dehydrogenase subunit gamma